MLSKSVVAYVVNKCVIETVSVQANNDTRQPTLESIHGGLRERTANVVQHQKGAVCLVAICMLVILLCIYFNSRNASRSGTCPETYYAR